MSPQLIVFPCVKCGGEKIGSVWVPPRSSHYIGSHDRDQEGDEHLRHRCENCRYAWNTPTLDTQRETT